MCIVKRLNVKVCNMRLCVHCNDRKRRPYNFDIIIQRISVILSLFLLLHLLTLFCGSQFLIQCKIKFKIINSHFVTYKVTIIRNKVTTEAEMGFHISPVFPY